MPSVLRWTSSQFSWPIRSASRDYARVTGYMEIGFHLTLTGHSVNWRFVVKKSGPPERRAMIVNLRGLSTPSWPETLVLYRMRPKHSQCAGRVGAAGRVGYSTRVSGQCDPQRSNALQILRLVRCRRRSLLRWRLLLLLLQLFQLPRKILGKATAKVVEYSVRNTLPLSYADAMRKEYSCDQPCRSFQARPLPGGVALRADRLGHHRSANVAISHCSICATSNIQRIRDEFAGAFRSSHRRPRRHGEAAKYSRAGYRQSHRILLTGQQLSPSATVPSAPQATSSASVTSLPAPFGRHTDDLDGMVKRQNIRALVIVNPIGFF